MTDPDDLDLLRSRAIPTADATDRRRPLSLAALGLVAAVAVVAAAVLVVRPGRSGPPPRPRRSPTPTTNARALRNRGTPDRVDRAKLRDPVEIDGDVVIASGHRYRVGVTGDVVMAGDWDCDGRATLALFRPASASLFRFDQWATPGRDVTVEAATTVSGGVRARVADVDGDGCDEVVVDRRAGRAAVVRLSPRAAHR